MGIPHPTGSRKMEIVGAAICHQKLSSFLHNLCQRPVNKEEKVGSGAASRVCRVLGPEAFIHIEQLHVSMKWFFPQP